MKIKLSATSTTGISKITSAGGFMGFMRGFVNGTKTATTQNMTVCQTKVETKWDAGATKLVNYTLDGHGFKVLETLLDMIYNLHNITISCYTGLSEMGYGLKNYALQLQPSTIMDNVVYNFGNIFDAFRDDVLFFTSNPRGEFNLPYEAGYAAGAAVYLIMQP